MVRRKLVFIRDDDVYKDSEHFRRFFRFCRGRGILLVYAVVPGLLEPKLAAFLLHQKKKYPRLFDIVQHGYQHTNYADGPKHKYEFGVRRNFVQQRNDIRRGMALMEKYFRSCYTPAFVPPYHGYNRTTLKIIEAFKIPLFSAGVTTAPKKKKYKDFPAQVALNDYAPDGTPRALSCRQMIERFIAVFARRGGVTGMVLHHETLEHTACFKEMKLFLLFLKKMEERHQLKIVMFSQLLGKGVCRSGA